MKKEFNTLGKVRAIQALRTYNVCGTLTDAVNFVNRMTEKEICAYASVNDVKASDAEVMQFIRLARRYKSLK